LIVFRFRLISGGASLPCAHAVSDEFLRMCEKPGVPPHELKLSKGCVAMITRNMDGKFKNGRRVVVLSIGRRTVHVVDAEAYCRNKENPELHPMNEDDYLLVPRILFKWAHRRIGLTIQRRQFPLRAAYAVTFNKSQGKTLKRAVVDLRCQAFAHGQLYVALSRVRRSTDLTLMCSPNSIIQEQYLDDQGQQSVMSFVVATNVVERKQLLSTMPLHLQAGYQQAFQAPP
jgi:hypothetical protein